LFVFFVPSFCVGSVQCPGSCFFQAMGKFPRTPSPRPLWTAVDR
jgi:hypothetical protein